MLIIQLLYLDAGDVYAAQLYLNLNRRKTKMGKVILKTDVKREQGKLYYCGTDSNGCITLCEAIMARGRKKKRKK